MTKSHVHRQRLRTPISVSRICQSVAYPMHTSIYYLPTIFYPQISEQSDDKLSPLVSITWLLPPANSLYHHAESANMTHLVTNKMLYNRLPFCSLNAKQNASHVNLAPNRLLALLSWSPKRCQPVLLGASQTDSLS